MDQTDSESNLQATNLAVEHHHGQCTSDSRSQGHAEGQSGSQRSDELLNKHQIEKPGTSSEDGRLAMQSATAAERGRNEPETDCVSVGERATNMASLEEWHSDTVSPTNSPDRGAALTDPHAPTVPKGQLDGRLSPCPLDVPATLFNNGKDSSLPIVQGTVSGAKEPADSPAQSSCDDVTALLSESGERSADNANDIDSSLSFFTVLNDPHSAPSAEKETRVPCVELSTSQSEISDDLSHLPDLDAPVVDIPSEQESNESRTGISHGEARTVQVSGERVDSIATTPDSLPQSRHKEKAVHQNTEHTSNGNSDLVHEVSKADESKASESPLETSPGTFTINILNEPSACSEHEPPDSQRAPSEMATSTNASNDIDLPKRQETTENKHQSEGSTVSENTESSQNSGDPKLPERSGICEETTSVQSTDNTAQSESELSIAMFDVHSAAGRNNLVMSADLNDFSGQSSGQPSGDVSGSCDDIGFRISSVISLSDENQKERSSRKSDKVNDNNTPSGQTDNKELNEARAEKSAEDSKGETRKNGASKTTAAKKRLDSLTALDLSFCAKGVSNANNVRTNEPLNLSVEASPPTSDHRTTPVESHFDMGGSAPSSAAAATSPVTCSTVSSPGVASNRSVSPTAVTAVTVTRSSVKKGAPKQRVNKRKRKEPVRSQNYKEVQFLDVTDSFDVPPTSILETENVEIKQEKEAPTSDFFDTRLLNPVSVAPATTQTRPAMNMAHEAPPSFMHTGHTIHHMGSRMPNPQPTLHVIEPEGYITPSFNQNSNSFCVRANFPPQNNFLSSQLQRLARHGLRADINSPSFVGRSTILPPPMAGPISMGFPVNMNQPILPQPINIAPEMPNGPMYHQYPRTAFLNDITSMPFRPGGHPNFISRPMRQFNNQDFLGPRGRAPRHNAVNPQPIAIVPTFSQQLVSSMAASKGSASMAKPVVIHPAPASLTGASSVNSVSTAHRFSSDKPSGKSAKKGSTNKRPVASPLAITFSASGATRATETVSTRTSSVDDDEDTVTSEILKKKYPIFKAVPPPACLNIDAPAKPAKCLGCSDVFYFTSSLNDHINRKSMKIEYNCLECKEVKVFWNRCTLFIHAKGHAKGAKAYRLNINNAVIKVLPEELMPSVKHKEKENEKEKVKEPVSEESTVNPLESAENSVNSNQSVQKDKECSSLNLRASSPEPLRGSVQSPIEIPDSPISERTPKQDNVKSLHSRLQSPSKDLAKTMLRFLNYKIHVNAHNELRFCCPECERMYVNTLSMVSHFTGTSRTSAAASSAFVKCNTCGLEIRGRCAMIAHRRIHTKTPPHVCPECGELIRGERDVFLKHLTQRCLHFQRSLLMRCTICNIVILFDSNTVTSHYLEHHSTKYYKCVSCPMAFKTEGNWLTHRNEVHKSVKGMKCKMICKCAMCDTVFHDVSSVNTHFKNAHFPGLGESACFVAYKCTSCHPQKLFNSKTSYANHITQVHKLKVIQEMCNTCGYEATSLEDLLRHCEADHHVEKVIHKVKDKMPKAVDADEKDTEKDASGLVTPERTGQKSPPNIKIYKCDKCKTLLRSVEAYEKHMEKHSSVEKQKNSGEKGLSIKLKKMRDGTEKDGEFKVVTSDEENNSEPNPNSGTDCENTTNGVGESRQDKQSQEVDENKKQVVLKPRGKTLKFKRKFAASYVDLDDSRARSSPTVKVKKDFMGQVPTAPSPKPRFSCSECAEKCHSQQMLREHLRMSHGIAPQFPCHLCGNTYDSASHVARHIATVHEGKVKDLPYWCWICMENNSMKGYPNWKMLERHLINAHKLHKNHIDYSKFMKHPSAQNGIDDEEGKSETGSDSVKRPGSVDVESDVPVKRLRTRGDTVFSCAKCTFTAEKRERFSQHIAKHKADETEMQCAECGLCFTVLPALKRHLFMVHKIKDLEKYRSETGVDLDSVESLAIGRSATFTGLTGSPFKSQIPNGIKAPSAQKKKTPKGSREKSPEKAGDPLVTLQCNVCYKSFEDATKLRSHMRMHGMAFIRSRRAEVKK